MRPIRFLSRLFTFAVLLAALPLAACYNSDDLSTEPERIINNSATTAERMYSDPEFTTLLDLSTRAKALLIFPNMLRAAFIFGGRGGNGVLITRDATTGSWSAPAFYTIGGINWGLQFGGQQQEIIVAIMTERGLNAVIDRRATLGADASVAAGEVGKGVQASTGVGINSDMYAFAKTAGLYIGVSLDGSVIWPRHEWNEQLYGPGATPQGILIDRLFTSDKAARLTNAMP